MYLEDSQIQPQTPKTIIKVVGNTAWAASRIFQQLYIDESILSSVML